MTMLYNNFMTMNALTSVALPATEKEEQFLIVRRRRMRDKRLMLT